MDTPQTQTLKRVYAPPTLEDAGAVARITMGANGSSCDGNLTNTQRFNGNDGEGPPGQCGV